VWISSLCGVIWSLLAKPDPHNKNKLSLHFFFHFHQQNKCYKHLNCTDTLVNDTLYSSMPFRKKSQSESRNYRRDQVSWCNVLHSTRRWQCGHKFHADALSKLEGDLINAFINWGVCLFYCFLLDTSLFTFYSVLLFSGAHLLGQYLTAPFLIILLWQSRLFSNFIYKN